MNPNSTTRGAMRACLRGLCLAGVLFAMACAGSTEEKPLRLETGPDAEVTPDGLVRAKGSSLGESGSSPTPTSRATTRC